MTDNHRRFRNKLEAHWAAFFDELREPYQYGIDEFAAKPNANLLPDFWLPEREFWIKVVRPGIYLNVEESLEVFPSPRDKIFIFYGFPEVRLFADQFDVNLRIAQICDFGIYMADERDSHTWLHYSGIDLNQTMLYILGLWNRDTSIEVFRHHTHLLSIAVTRVRNHFKDDTINLPESEI